MKATSWSTRMDSLSKIFDPNNLHSILLKKVAKFTKQTKKMKVSKVSYMRPYYKLSNLTTITSAISKTKSKQESHRYNIIKVLRLLASSRYLLG